MKVEINGNVCKNVLSWNLFEDFMTSIKCEISIDYFGSFGMHRRSKSKFTRAKCEKKLLLSDRLIRLFNFVKYGNLFVRSEITAMSPSTENEKEHITSSDVQCLCIEHLQWLTVTKVRNEAVMRNQNIFRKSSTMYIFYQINCNITICQLLVAHRSDLNKDPSYIAIFTLN